MAERDWTYRLIALPDAADRTLAIRANGSVCAAAQADCKHLARMAADLPPDSATVVVRYVFNPDLHASKEGERLSVYLMGRAHCDVRSGALGLLLGRGPLPRIYRLKPEPAPAVNWDQFSATCDVVRRFCVFPSTLTAELNPLALSHYIQIHSFEPAGEHDDLRLDKVLDRVQEPVLLEVAVEPCDTSPLLTAHTNYLARLKEINQTWDTDEEDAGRSSWTHGEWSSFVASLKHRDPLAEDVGRTQQRFHETLTKRHLRFHIRVLAGTPAVARLLASTIAENAFAGGSYQLIDTVRGDAFFENALQAHRELCVAVPPVLPCFADGPLDDLCSALSPLSNLPVA